MTIEKRVYEVPELRRVELGRSKLVAGTCSVAPGPGEPPPPPEPKGVR